MKRLNRARKAHGDLPSEDIIFSHLPVSLFHAKDTPLDLGGYHPTLADGVDNQLT
jgi:hypothetical protein